MLFIADCLIFYLLMFVRNRRRNSVALKRCTTAKRTTRMS